MEYITELEPKVTYKKKKDSSEKKCNSCHYPLPKILDNGICPICGIRN